MQISYPFNDHALVTKYKKIKKNLLASSSSFIQKRIAVLGGVTTNDVIKSLELFLLDNGIQPEFYQSEYNQYYQDAMFANAELEKFNPEIIYVCTSIHNITQFPSLEYTKDQVFSLIDEEYQKFSKMWETLSEKYHCPIIQNNFDPPYYRLLGNKDATDIHGRVNFVTRLNLKFAEFVQEHPNFYICDLNYIASDYGIFKWADQFYWHMYKYPCAIDAIPYIAFNVANIIKSLLGKNKKGFVLDLDNTLWGGVVGDDGPENVEVGPEESVGQAYLEFQNYIKDHKQLGVILNVDSKNDEDNAINGLKISDGVLKPDDFIVIKANWDPKDRNFADIAQELNLLPESLVFVDDNPAERAIVTGQLKGVCAPELHEVTDYIKAIDRQGFFEVTNLSADDRKRNLMYKENIERAHLQAQFSDYKDYLLSLEMKSEIKSFVPLYMARIAQLTNKSNQFNLTTKRYTQTEIEDTATNSNYITLYGKLADKFGDNGVVSVVIGHQIGDECHIDLWIMSCRVLKRDMEFAMTDALVHACKNRGIKKIIGYYYPTAKNGMVKEFYRQMGYEQLSIDEKGNSSWCLDLTKAYDDQNHVINVEE